jgi:hypothetical protein
MLEAVRTPMYVFVVIAWLLSAGLIVAVMRSKPLKPDVRRTLRRVSWVFGASAIFAVLGFRVGLPGWFNACMFLTSCPSRSRSWSPAWTWRNRSSSRKGESRRRRCAKHGRRAGSAARDSYAVTDR